MIVFERSGSVFSCDQVDPSQWSTVAPAPPVDPCKASSAQESEDDDDETPSTKASSMSGTGVWVQAEPSQWNSTGSYENSVQWRMPPPTQTSSSVIASTAETYVMSGGDVDMGNGTCAHVVPSQRMTSGVSVAPE